MTLLLALGMALIAAAKIRGLAEARRRRLDERVTGSWPL